MYVFWHLRTYNRSWIARGCLHSQRCCSVSLRYPKVSLLFRSCPTSYLTLYAVTTRTTSLTSVPHPAFALRFSDVLELEDAVHEDEEQRASRTMDWIGSRISQRCERWMDLVETDIRETGGKTWRSRTPWWDEVKRCVSGDHVPSSVEGWNHPVACAYSSNNHSKLCILNAARSDSHRYHNGSESATGPTGFDLPRI